MKRITRAAGQLRLRRILGPKGLLDRRDKFLHSSDPLRLVYDLSTQDDRNPGKSLHVDIEVRAHTAYQDPEEHYRAHLLVGDECKASSPEAAMLRLADWMERGAAGLRAALAGDGVNLVPVSARGQWTDEGCEE